MIDYNSIELALYNRGFKFQATPRTLMFWYDIAKDYYISAEFRYVSDEIEISGFANRMCAYRRNGKFTAYIGVNKKQVWLGYFTNFEDAVNARLKAEEKYGYKGE